jgi:hypothetical protein
MQTFNPKAPLAKQVLTFDMTNDLAPNGANMLGQAPVVTVASVYGTDPNPTAILNGNPEIDPTGLMILVPVEGGLLNEQYVITVECPTSNALIQASMAAILPIGFQ